LVGNPDNLGGEIITLLPEGAKLKYQKFPFIIYQVPNKEFIIFQFKNKGYEQIFRGKNLPLCCKHLVR